MTYSGLSVFSNSIRSYFSVNSTVHHLKFWEQTAQELIIPRDMEARKLWAINWGNTISYTQASKSKLLLCSVILQVWLCTLCSLWFEGNYKLVPEPLQVRWDFFVKDKNLCWGIVFRQLGWLLGFHVCFALSWPWVTYLAPSIFTEEAIKTSVQIFWSIAVFFAIAVRGDMGLVLRKKWMDK